MPKLIGRLSMLLVCASALVGCKLAVIVVEGGEVQSTASGTCLARTVCIHEVTDTTYTESFTAIPNSGWHFEKWNTGEGFLCANSTDPTCVVSNVPLAGITAAEELVDSALPFYIMPVFGLGQPIHATIIVDGKEWANPYPFFWPTWNEVNEVCPDGVCLDGSLLRGYDLTGWKWATVEDAIQLFNYYIGSEELGPAPSSYAELDSTWAPAFFADGWPTTLEDNAMLGLLSTESAGGADWVHLTNSYPGDYDRVYAFGGRPLDERDSELVVMFYRDVLD